MTGLEVKNGFPTFASVGAKSLHVAFSFFLAASLLFTQAGLGYFHDNHNAHERIDQAQKNQTQLHKHGEHCKLCSIDLFFSLFVDDPIITINHPRRVVIPSITHEARQNLLLRFFEGRAPPLSVI